MIKKSYVESFQGHRWIFKCQDYGDNIDMIDTLEEFPAIEMPLDMANVLAMQLGMLQKYQDDDRSNQLVVNQLLDFVRENQDIDSEIMIAIINKLI